MWWSSGSGRIELKMTLAQAQSASHSGSCDEDVQALSQIPASPTAENAALLADAMMREWEARK